MDMTPLEVSCMLFFLCLYSVNTYQSMELIAVCFNKTGQRNKSRMVSCPVSCGGLLPRELFCVVTVTSFSIFFLCLAKFSLIEVSSCPWSADFCADYKHFHYECEALSERLKVLSNLLYHKPVHLSLNLVKVRFHSIRAQDMELYYATVFSRTTCAFCKLITLA